MNDQSFILEVLRLEVSLVCLSQLFIQIGNGHIGSNTILALAGCSALEPSAQTAYSPILCKFLRNGSTNARSSAGDEGSLFLEG